MSQPIKILHFAPIWGAPEQGLSYSIPALVEAQNDEGACVDLITTAPRQPDIEFFGKPLQWIKQISEKKLKQRVAGSDLLVFHSTYIPVHAKIAKWAISSSVPYVIVPRGGLTLQASCQSKWKKAVADWWFFRKFVQSAAALHCLTEGEAMESRRWHSKIFVVGNGIELKDISRRNAPFGLPFKAVYIGRLSIRQKGLDLLLEAFARFLDDARGEKPFKLILCGPSEKDSRSRLVEMARQLNISEHVSIRDGVYGKEKAQVLSQAAVFCQTSRFEGHSMALLEALAQGIPALLTSGSNMGKEISGANAGWPVESNVADIKNGFDQIFAARDQLEFYSRNARKLAENYRWSSVAQLTIEAYHKILNK